MKNLMAGALMIFGTAFLTAQITPQQDSTRTKSEKKMKNKSQETVQPNGMNRTVDTATINNRSKMQSNPDRLQQNQTLPNNGTLQNPNTTIPNNSTIPQQPLGPNSPTNPNPTR